MAGRRENLSERLLRSRRTDAVVFGDFIYDPSGTHGPRTQVDFQLVFLFSGSATVRVNELALTLGEGEACILRPGGREFFTFAVGRPTHHGWCAVRPGTLSGLSETLLTQAASGLTKVTISKRATQLLELAFSIPEEGSAARLLESLAVALFEEFLLAVEVGNMERATPPLPAAVVRARDFIAAHYPDPLDLIRIGRAAGVAPKHLGRLFRRHLGTTPIRHLWMVRTASGAQLLTETGLSLGEIAGRVGFQNPFHFSRLVRQQFGVSPRQLRVEYWNAASTEPPSRPPSPP